ncbi:MAG: IdeS/Mac family cysteine endopeptidase [Treponema sp.]|uniref:IdeS/Mac family cysteine endopeptidase n=1 Tax=Treponema sp. TaxID=166 RepID=UPI003FA1CCB3
MKKILISFLSVLTVLFFAACNNNTLPTEVTKTVAVTDIAFEPELTTKRIALTTGKTYKLNAKVKPENATNKKLTYTSSNEKVASVNANGEITAQAVGSAKITVKATGTILKEIDVTVTAAYIPVTGISLVPHEDEDIISVVNRTDDRQIKAHVTPENATNKKLTFSLDNEEIASITDEGKITAKQVGHANITIKAADDISKTVPLTVTAAPVPVQSIVLDPAPPKEPIELVVGANYRLYPKAMPDNATNQELSVTSSDESIAWPNEDGNRCIKAQKAGSATITITSVGTPNVKREIQVVIKNPPEISIETPSVQYESTEGNVTFTVKTINGKLDYTPEVIGGGKEWVDSVSKNNTTNENTDTIRLYLKKNKTVWYRNAYIKFKGADSKYIKSKNKNSNGKFEDLQVKIIQKRNEHPVVTIKWVHGITRPTENEKDKVEIPHTYPQAYHEMPYVFTWNETSTTTFFNTRKLTHTHAPYGAFPDGNQCWAKTDANMLHWWFEQNKDNIKNYIEKKGITGDAVNMYKPYYKRGLADNEEHEKSSIANLFREKCINEGGDPANGLAWYLFGFNNFAKARNKSYSPALFKDVFNKNNTPVARVTIRTKKEFEDTLKAALNSKKAVGLNRYGAEDETQHAITLWGAAFDEEDNIIAIYVVDNNDVPNRVFTYGIQYQNGVDIYAEPDYEHNDRLRYNPYFFNYSSNSLSSNHCIGEIITLDKGETQWQDWLSKH